MLKTELIKAIGDCVIDYIKDDMNAKYGLNKEVSATFIGDGIGIGTCTVGVLTIKSIGGDMVKLIAKPFAPESGLWNGPNIIPDTWDDGSMEMSLWHDLIWVYAKDIGKALNMSEQEVMKWGNGILVAAWNGYAEKYGKNRGWMANVAYRICEVGRRFWRFIVSVAIVALLTGCNGCSAIPEWTMEESTSIEYVKGE